MTGNQCGEELKKFINIDTRVSCLGHIQRGGTPTGMDRVLASRLGGYAVELLMQGDSAKAVGIQQNELHVLILMKYSKQNITSTRKCII